VTLRHRLTAPPLVALAAWLGVAWLALTRATGARPGVLARAGVIPPPRPALVWLALAVTGLAIAAAVAIVRGRLPRGMDVRRVRWEAGLVGLPLAIALARVSGGVASPAVVAVALAVLALARSRGLLLGAAASALALAALVLGAGAATGPIVIVATLLVAVGLLPAWIAERGAGRVDEARERALQLERFLARRATPASAKAIPGTLRAEVIRKYASDAERRQQEVLADLLEDVREVQGADSAVYWRFSRDRMTLEAAAWTGGGPRPELVTIVGGTHVEWAAREGLTALDSTSGKRATVAAAPVHVADDEILGALSIHGAAGLKAPVERLRVWLPRHALQLSRMAALLETAGDATRESINRHAIIAAALDFHEQAEEFSLAREICRTALQVTGGTWAALVQWDAPTRIGRVAYTTTDGMPEPMRVLAPHSVIADRCVEAKAMALEDARSEVAGRVLLYEGEPSGEVASLGFYPLRDRHAVAIGAIVVADGRRGKVRIDDIQNVDLLGRFASYALESVWTIADVERRARTDQLTGLNNRRHFDEEFGKLKARAQRATLPEPCSLLMADVDFFKKVNDSFGHDAGDAVLKAVARTFRDRVREVDICARFGGEEIAVLLPSTPRAGALELAERLRQAIEGQAIRHGGREIRVTASFGVATFPETARTWDSLFVAADKALYEAKRGGRNQVRSSPPVVEPSAT
jgi:diguanylate cyclase (GGDEF)-like protein